MLNTHVSGELETSTLDVTLGTGVKQLHGRKKQNFGKADDDLEGNH